MAKTDYGFDDEYGDAIGMMDAGDYLETNEQVYNQTRGTSSNADRPDPVKPVKSYEPSEDGMSPSERPYNEKMEEDDDYTSYYVIGAIAVIAGIVYFRPWRKRG